MSKHTENISKLNVAFWEADEYVIVLDGVGPIGGTLHKTEANTIRQWLASTDLVPARLAMSGIADPGAWRKAVDEFLSAARPLRISVQNSGRWDELIEAITKAERGE